MAAEPWNRVNIPFPGAVSSVRVHFSSTTGTIHCVFGAKLRRHRGCAACNPTWERTDPPSAVLMLYWCSSSSLWCFACCCCDADAHVKSLLVENEKVLKLIRSELLQTEIRVLYELLYILNNSSRGNKTFKGLKQVRTADKTLLLDMYIVDLVWWSVLNRKAKEVTHYVMCMCHVMLHILAYLSQVEQCINRLKSMELGVALQELTDLCPSRIQR